LLAKGVQWTFNPPTASHHGGVWVRQIWVRGGPHSKSFAAVESKAVHVSWGFSQGRPVF